MGKLLTAMRVLPHGVVDNGWRVSMYPAGTLYADALEQELVIQGENGCEIDLATVTTLQAHWMPTTADYLPDEPYPGARQQQPDKGWRNMCAPPFNMLCIRFQRHRVGPVHHTYQVGADLVSATDFAGSVTAQYRGAVAVLAAGSSFGAAGTVDATADLYLDQYRDTY